MPVFLKDVLDEAVKIEFIKHQPLTTCLCNIPCDEIEIHLKHFYCALKCDGEVVLQLFEM